MASIISAGTTSGTALNMAGDTSGVLQLATNGSTTAITIDTSQRAAFVAGTAAAPAITTTGDTNTGIWFPAADTIAFAEGGAESMRIDSTGNVGIGTTSPASRLHIKQDQDGTTRSIIQNRNATGTPISELSFITGSFDLSDNRYAYIQSAGGASTYIAFGTGNGATPSERMRIDSSGSVLMGTTSGGTGKLRVSGGNDAFLSPYNAPSAGYFFSSNSADANCVEIFQGRFNKAGLTMSANNSGTVIQVEFFQTGSSRGSISTNNSVTAYNTSSDYRLKENIAPMTGALNKVAQLKPVTFTWKETGNQSQGFIAHELAEIVPDAVTGEKDAVETYTDEEGNEQTRIKPQGIDASFLVATLTAAIQEQQTIINDLKARITALEGAA
jgi:hypothetical protein